MQAWIQDFSLTFHSKSTSLGVTCIQRVNKIMLNEQGHVISNNVAFWQVQTQTSLCSLLLSLETPIDVQSVA